MGVSEDVEQKTAPPYNGRCGCTSHFTPITIETVGENYGSTEQVASEPRIDETAVCIFCFSERYIVTRIGQAVDDDPSTAPSTAPSGAN